MAALRARGLEVSGHKVGPDYIDPGYHELASGRPRRNLDPFLCGAEQTVPLFLHGADRADIAVVEGAMGMFDGADPALEAGEAGFASTAHVARLLSAPVVLVVDAARAGRSVAALVEGFARFDPRTPVAGVILNKVASDRHERLLREALTVPVFGVIRRTGEIVTPARHLGLIPAGERRNAASEAVDRMGVLIAKSCDIDGLLALARTAPPLPGPAWEAAPGNGHGKHNGTIAIAGGAAFTFGYTEQREQLEASGLTVAEFDPLTDEDLPAGTTGVIVGGGFPELHAEGLAANEKLRARMREFTGPVVAECAGLLYLATALDGHPMCGVIDATATMTPKLTLGYRRATATRDSVTSRTGQIVHAHEFHRTAITPAGDAWGPAGGYATGTVTASYLHVHWAGYPEFAHRFAKAAG
jgi:cobyrinic acid a,c-diamide synthase